MEHTVSILFFFCHLYAAGRLRYAFIPGDSLGLVVWFFVCLFLF